MSSSRVKETRRFDHVYDPIFTASGYRDHARSNQSALQTTFVRVPNKNNMFSELSSVYPNHQVRISQKSELPKHVDTSFQPYDSSQAAAGFSADIVSGANRSKYFRRPNVPILESAPPEILLAKISNQASPAVKGNEQEEKAEVTTTKGTQTMYRESEAQTLPYSPEYVIPKGANPEPEILQLGKFTVQNGGLPATMEQVEIIEHAREKKKFIASLPPITDEASFALRKRMMEEQETRDFRKKEKDIDRTQAEHLRLLKQALDEREAEAQFISDQRIEVLRQSKLDEKDAKLAEIQKQRIKQLRKLAKSRAAVNPDRANHFDIIDEYSSYTSKTYAPLLRDGSANAHGLRLPGESHKIYLEEYGGFLHMEEGIPSKHSTVNVTRPGPPDQSKNVVLGHLEWMDGLLASRKPNVEETTQLAQQDVQAQQQQQQQPAWRRRAEKLVRPPTPSAVHSEVQNDEDLETAITLLQTLLRGRAIQTMMFQGKSKRLELIRELRTEEELGDTVEKAEKSNDVDQVEDLDEKARDASWEAVEGEVISFSLDLLSKELQRAKQEEEVFALVADANETRRRREMMQAGTRQAETMHREREEEIYRQLMRVHQGTVDSYFDDILQDCVEQLALQKAYAQVEQVSSEKPDNVVHDLLSNVLLPRVQRDSLHQEKRAEHAKYLKAAGTALSQAMQNLDK